MTQIPWWIMAFFPIMDITTYLCKGWKGIPFQYMSSVSTQMHDLKFPSTVIM